MEASTVRAAVAAATASARAFSLAVDEVVVLQNSNKLALRLLPGDVMARVAPATNQVAHLEVELAQRFREAGCPVAALDPRVEPRVYERDGFLITFWTFYESLEPRAVDPADYAAALARLHAGMRTVDVATPHFTERVDVAEQLVADRERTPGLTDADRTLLGGSLRRLRRSVGTRGGEQLLHGDPHPDNLLDTKNGLLFIDLETCCRGPVEFDLAHAPEAVGEHYPGADQDLFRECRLLVLAIITTWRWDRDDQFPDGRRLGREWLGRLRTAVDQHELDGAD